MNMEFKRRLPAPEEVINMYPVTEAMKAQKVKNDQAIRSVFRGESDKLLLVIGPCSADREDAVLDYISRLRPIQEKVKDKIVIVPRIYTN
ncbi:MAG: 3-deoxy-7-phosphoheptulonate synthase, partial [Candidatus Faecivicinus sp.]|nr:3-deoxy-7-phosphoheptulonate synthase [Candidatus Faecivicinus sp.]